MRLIRAYMTIAKKTLEVMNLSLSKFIIKKAPVKYISEDITVSSVKELCNTKYPPNNSKKMVLK
ncbi:hypothetical protein PvtlMGM2_0607 [Prevotella sp. MGM2]|nr:hypothetical protein PvtlMGM2_0607 [Prevotella sp. MGM2]